MPLAESVQVVGAVINVPGPEIAVIGVQPPGPMRNPDPETPTVVSAVPEVGLRMMRGVTEKRTVEIAGSPSGSPTICTMKEFGGEPAVQAATVLSQKVEPAPTVKLPDSVPPLTLQVRPEITRPGVEASSVTMQPESAESKPVPVTVTVCPGRTPSGAKPEDGLREAIR